MEDYTAEMIKDMAFSFCPQCGTAIIPNHKGRPRKFCSPECRSRWNNTHPKPENWKTVRSKICPVCGCQGAGEDAAAFWNETFSDRRADGNACGTGDGLLPGTGIAGNRKLPSGAAGPSERTQMSSLRKNHRAEWKRCAEKILFG